jgi:hypothetical protein
VYGGSGSDSAGDIVKIVSDSSKSYAILKFKSGQRCQFGSFGSENSDEMVNYHCDKGDRATSGGLWRSLRWH